MACYEQALAGNPDYPQYLANIGSHMLTAGTASAEAFLQRLAKHRAQHPLAVNEFVEAIEADCLDTVGRGLEASYLRRGRIGARSSHAAFYSAEANYWLKQGDPGEAMRVLDQSEQNGAGDSYTESVRFEVLEALGRGREASRLRRERIETRTNNPAFYGAEAEYQLSQGDAGEAMRMLDLARVNGAANPFTETIRGKVLEALGRGPEASRLRRERIDARSNDPAFYSAEAECQLAQGDASEALRLLELAQQNEATDDYTDSILGKVFEALGRGAEASRLRRERIDARSNNPVFYAAEAEYQLSRGDLSEAMRVIDLAELYGAADAHMNSVRIKVLDALARVSPAG